MKRKHHKVAGPAVEEKSLAEPTLDLLSLFGAIPSPSGISVSTEQALRVTAVVSCIKLISEAAGSLDMLVKRIEADGTETNAPDHPVQRLLAGDCNDWTSGAELVADLVSDALQHDLGGTAHVSRTSDGRVIELARYTRSYLQVTLDPATGEPSFAFSDRQLRAADVVHVRPPLGRAPLSLAREAIGVAVLLEQHAANLFSRGARPSGALLFPKGMGESAMKTARAAWLATHGGAKDAGNTAFLYDGATFQPFQLSSVDAQFLELRKFQILEIARAFRVPPTLLFDLDRGTWGNAEEMGKTFLTYCLEPWLQTVEAAMRRSLFSPEEREAGFVVRFDRDDLTRADLTARAIAINGLIASRTLSPNEGRQWLGLAPRAGGDEYLNPNISATPLQAPVTAKPAKEATE